MMRTKRWSLVLVLACVAAFLLSQSLPAWACGKVSFSPQSYVVGENSGHVVLTMTLVLNNPESRTRTIPYNTKAGTAKAGTDFKSTSGSVTFSPGTTSRTLAIDIVNDATDEPTERFDVELKPGTTNQCIEAGPDASVVIQDDDPKPKPTPPRGDETDPPPASGADPTPGSSVTVDPEGSATTSASTSPSPTASDSMSSPLTADDLDRTPGGDGSGLTAFALVGILIAGAIGVGAAAALVARRRSSATQPPS